MNITISLIGNSKSIGGSMKSFRRAGIPFLYFSNLNRTDVPRYVVGSRTLIRKWSKRNLVNRYECRVMIRERDYAVAVLAAKSYTR
jgi:hypothetical protein